MRQLGTYDRSGGHLGAWTQGRIAADIAAVGNTVTLANGSTPKALFLSDPKDFQRYIPQDGQLLGRGKIQVMFVFDGAMLGKVKASDKVTFGGVRYTVDSPVHPQIEQEVCVALAVLCFVA